MSSIKDVEKALNINININFINSIESITDKKESALALFDNKTIKFKENLSIEDIKKANNKENFKQLLFNEEIPRDILTNDKYSAYIKSNNEVKRLIMHELGHAFANKYEGMCDKFAGNIKIASKETCEELSLYACMNSNEFFAESFADMILNKDKSSKYGKQLKLFLKENYGF